MKSIFCKGLKQTDYEIFKYVDDKDIGNLCLLNSYSNQIINENNFWLQRFFYKYGKYVEDIDIKYFQSKKKNWREYYIEIYKYIKNPFPFYSSAMALSLERDDVLSILENILKIQNVINVVVKHREENELEYYYTRNGNPNGIKEGYHYTIELNNLSGSTFSHLFVSKRKNRTEKIYKNGFLLSVIVYEENKIILLTKYEKYGTKTTKWNKKEVKIYEEDDFNGQKNIKEWFVDGKIKSEKFFHNGKKTGIWSKWNKKGEKTEKYYLNDKLKPFKPTTQAEDFELLNNLRRCVINKR
jgi:hypothetical protein